MPAAGATVQRVPPARKPKSKAASVVSGSVSGALVSACVQPLDVVRTRMQADAAQGLVRGTMATIHTILAEVRRSLASSGRCPIPQLSQPCSDAMLASCAPTRAACGGCGGARSLP